ncbi:MAG TPA: SPOR domain-containing protein [Blastocatellia bacterium]|nr:SPOR domain-containing protein [Blastocatellia bacterium]
MDAPENERGRPVDADPLPSDGADVLFDVGLDGATPAGIPVEPAAVLFETPERGFGGLFGEMPQPDQDPAVRAKRLPVQEVERGGQPEARAAILPSKEPHHGETSGPRTPMQRLPGEAQSSPPQGGSMRTLNLAQTPGGQAIESEPSQNPVARRPGSKSESDALSELAQSVGARRSGPLSADTSLSDLAAATGIRRNTAPIEVPSSAQPHNAPLDGWGQSAHEYPVLIPGPDSNSKSRMRWPLVILLLLALLATAGYFLGFQKWITSAKPQAPQASNPIRKETEAPAASVATQSQDPAVKPPETAPPVVKPPEAAPAVVRTETQPPEVSAPGNVDAAQARYSLQAASFPKEGQAKEFSDKLVRAGVPAYIMSIDIPRRGKWFRVRVGRFPSAEEAGKYVPQARQRARAAGINLELIVCDFEKT